MNVPNERAGHVALLWLVFVALMALVDGLTVYWSSDVRTSLWLILFFGASIGTVWILAETRALAIAVIVMMAGYFLTAYSLVWEATAILTGAYSVTSPVLLYPFNFYVAPWEWYGLMLLGLLLMIIGDGLLAVLGIKAWLDKHGHGLGRYLDMFKRKP
jgi:apolipoprotein N-acyltransferase